MACGVPVIASDVGGNGEVVASEALGAVYPFDNESALQTRLEEALAREWDRDGLLSYAAANAWNSRVRQLVSTFETLARLVPGTGGDPIAVSRLTVPK